MEHHIRVVEIRKTSKRFDNGFLVQSYLSKRDRLTHNATLKYDKECVVWIYSSFEDVLNSEHAMNHIFKALKVYLKVGYKRTYWFTKEYV